MRRLPLALGIVALLAAWLGPLPAWVSASFTAHMTMHVTVVGVAAPLLALGLAGSRLDPARAWPGMYRPVVAALVEMAVIWGWHAPRLHHLARHEPAALVVEQGLFLASGLLVWLSALGGERGGAGGRALAGIVGLLMTSMHMTVLGALLSLADRPLYGHGGAAAFGLSAVEDQNLGGVLMLLVGGSVYLLGALYLLAGALRPGGLPEDER